MHARVDAEEKIIGMMTLISFWTLQVGTHLLKAIATNEQVVLKSPLETIALPVLWKDGTNLHNPTPT